MLGVNLDVIDCLLKTKVNVICLPLNHVKFCIKFLASCAPN